jgi:hypothetical protein
MSALMRTLSYNTLFWTVKHFTKESSIDNSIKEMLFQSEIQLKISFASHMHIY